MLTAQIARLLSAMGKKVVIADFDFDAPGIPAVFGKKLSEVEKGLFDIVFNFAYGEKTVHEKWNSLEEYKKKIAQQLKRCFIHTKDIENNKEIENVRLLPSGKIDKEYWDTLSHPNITVVNVEVAHWATRRITEQCGFCGMPGYASPTKNYRFSGLFKVLQL